MYDQVLALHNDGSDIVYFEVWSLILFMSIFEVIHISSFEVKIKQANNILNTVQYSTSAGTGTGIVIFCKFYFYFCSITSSTVRVTAKWYFENFIGIRAMIPQRWHELKSLLLLQMKWTIKNPPPNTPKSNTAYSSKSKKWEWNIL